MPSYNRVILMGNLVRDPELRYTTSGTPVCGFGLAVNSTSGSGESKREEVLFIDVTTFGRQAETAAEYLSKGRAVLVEGRLTYRTWEAQDGGKRSKHEVVGERVQFLGQSGSDKASRDTTGVSSKEQEEDIPF